ncbi:hypothetical protein M413DRAFT_11278 [Hebeloma cylindrosporum]|uniref:Uncharacterized protein n=1 Tax=Hebeloma cylindrosporum TaxID=76867 RepID=A0A0C2XTT7_HEBCY|nr:hypothetical protein M413DRAFT_11278 [Hebeloma cylindrosporum h7]
MFREIQAKTGTLISGSTALQFFDRTVYEDSGLDLFVEHASLRPIAIWLGSIGYLYNPGQDSEFKNLEMALSKNADINLADDDSFFEPFFNKSGFKPIVTIEFCRDMHPNIQVFSSQGPPLEMVLDFHSTCTMNVITHKRAYSIYPRATFIERRLLAKFDGSHDEATITKYRKRGWKPLRHLYVEDYANPTSSFKKGIRSMGDHQCWIIDLYPTSDAEDDFMESNTWNFNHIHSSFRERSYERAIGKHDWKVLKDDLFKYAYLSDIDKMFSTRQILKAFKERDVYGEATLDKVYNEIVKLEERAIA